MEVKDWITLAAAFIVAIGWFVTGYLNRVKDVAQKRLEYRLKALETFLPVCVGARLKLPRSGRCRNTQSEGSLILTGLLVSVAHLHRRSCVGSALNEHSPRR